MHSHTVVRLKGVLNALFQKQKGMKASPDFLGKMSGASKGELSQRLADRLADVLEAARGSGHDSEAEDPSDAQSELGEDAEHGCSVHRKPLRKRARPAEQLGEVPHDSIISAAQAESALGRNLATDWDEDVFEVIDEDQRAEEEQLVGRLLHPQGHGVDYEFLAWSPDPNDVNHAPDLISPKDVNWHPGLPLSALSRQRFRFDAASVRGVLQRSVDEMAQVHAAEMKSVESAKDMQRQVDLLDPTQRLVYSYISSWAVRRQAWLSDTQGAASASGYAGPELRLLLLGTAGTGKTHTAKLCMRNVRQVLGRYESVLTVAFSGVAAANLGGGSRTIDSIFHTNADSASEDLVGDKLDALVAELRHVQLLLVDEISTVGAAQFELMSRRLQQVARVLFRERTGCEPPLDMGPFGGIGVVLMGDFAQLPPVMATSLLSGMPIVERHNSGLRGLAMAGQRSFRRDFSHVLRFRRIHRQKGADAFKESTMRLRDAAMTVADYDLWKTHELDSIDPM